MKKINVHVGQDINVDVVAPKFGRYPVGRYNGIICKLTLPDSIKRLDYGCTVLAKVGMVNEKFLSVMVMEVIVSAASNHAVTELKLNELKSMYVKPTKHEKPKKNYQFMSSNQLKTINNG